MFQRVVVLGLIAGCASSVTKYVDRGDAALAKNQLDAAEAMYRLAEEDQDDDEWVRAKVRAGRRKVELERLRHTDFATLTGEPEVKIKVLLNRPKRLGEVGGDEPTDARIVRQLNEVVAGVIQRAESVAASDPLAASRAAQTVVDLVDLDPALQRRATALITRAREGLLATAAQAGDAHPLTRHLYHVLATHHRGPGVPARTDLIAPHLRGLRGSTTNDEGACGFRYGLAGASGQYKPADVSIRFDECQHGTSTTTIQEPVTFPALSRPGLPAGR